MLFKWLFLNITIRNSIGSEKSCTNLQNITDCNCKTGHFCLNMKLKFENRTIQTCVPCRPGTFSDEENLSACKLCAPGSFQPLYESTECLETEKGFYVDKSGSVSKIKAEKGHFVNTTGASRQEPCPLGHYQNETGQASCIEADIGYFVDRIGSNDQTKCLLSFSKGMVSCPTMLYCDAGKYFDGTQCSDCPIGYYNPQANQTKCVPSPFQILNGDILSFFTSNSSGKYYIKRTAKGIEYKLADNPNAALGPQKQFQVLDSDEEGCFIVKSLSVFDGQYWLANSGSNKIDFYNTFYDAKTNISPLSKFKFTIVGNEEVLISSCYKERDLGYLNGYSGGQIFLNTNSQFHWTVTGTDKSPTTTTTTTTTFPTTFDATITQVDNFGQEDCND